MMPGVTRVAHGAEEKVDVRAVGPPNTSLNEGSCCLQDDFTPSSSL